jgi:hypothetical protein
MAIKYLNNVDLTKNELQNAVIQVLATAPSAPVEGQIYYDSTDDVIKFYNGTTWVSAGGDLTAITTATSNQLTITDGTGPIPNIDIVTGAVTSSGVALATGQQIYDFVYANAQEITVNGTTNEVEVTTTGGSVAGKIGPSDTVTIGLPNDVTISNDLTVTNDLTVNGNVTLGNALSDTVTIAGDLTVNGTTTSVNSNEVNIGDAIILLNSDETGTPSQNAGIEIKRGTSTNVSLLWDEGTDNWTFTNNGSTYYNIPTSYTTTIGDGSNTAYTVTHNLNSRNVIVQLYDSSSYETVYTDVERTTVNTLTVTFASAPTTGDITVLVTKIG